MSLRRLILAAAVLFAAVYCKLLMPSISAQITPFVRDMVACEQIELALPESAAAWFIRN